MRWNLRCDIDTVREYRSTAAILGVNGVISAVCLLTSISGLGGCGGRIEPSASAEQSDTSSLRSDTGSAAMTSSPIDRTTHASPAAFKVELKTRGVLLSGLPGSNAYLSLGALAIVQTKPTPLQSEWLRLDAILDRSATVGQVNTALIAVNARIVAMQPGDTRIALELARTDGGLSPQSAANQLTAANAFQSIVESGLAASAPSDEIDAVPVMSTRAAGSMAPEPADPNAQFH